MKFSRIALTSFATVFFVGKAYCAAPKEEEVNVLTDTAAIRSLQDDYTLLFNFKRTHDIRPDAELKFQSISINNTVVADGREFSLDGLTPMNVYTDDATYTVDGELQVGSPSDLSNIFTKTDGKHIIMVTTKGFGDEIDTVDIFGEDGSDIHMATIIPGVLTTIIPGDINPSTLEKLNLERDTMKAINDDDDDDNDGERLLRKKLRKKLKSMPQNPFENEKRALQSGCSTFRVIEIAIAFDSSFCSREGGFNSAKRSTEQIVARASQFYQAQGVCAKVRMTHLEANCISNQDPYRNVINGGFVCNEPNRDTILSQFGRFWRSNRSGIRRDVAHLFYGRDGQGSTIGCATVNALCSEQSGYGVNEISFSPNALARAVLFVHELGHNAGLSHVEGRPSSGAYIMASGLSTTSTYLWASFSVNRLKSNLSRFSCIGSEGGGPSPTPPVPTPTPPSGSGPCGCSSCTSSVLNRNAGGHRVGARIDWLEANRRMSERQACRTVCGQEFSNVCGRECNPDRCAAPTPTPPVPTPTPPSGSGPCGCSSCTSSVLNRNAGGHRVGARIDWLEANRRMSERQACTAVCVQEFPSVCGRECNPDRC